MNLQTVLKTGIWESVYKDPNHIINLFLCTSLNVFHASCPFKYKRMMKKNNWLTQVIKVSCKHKRSLYTFTKNRNDPKAHYIENCKIIRELIK
jgi:hypothetical protein